MAGGKPCWHCRTPLPVTRKAELCRDCQREYMRKRRAKEREERRAAADLQYCSTCGLRVAPGGACCPGARLVPPARLRWWNGDQWEILFLLRENKGVMEARSILLQKGWSSDRLLRWGRKLGTELGAVISPYLYTDNACGVIVFLTPRGRDARG